MSTFSKNLFDILGDDDEVRQPAPVKEVKKADEAKPAAATTEKRGGNPKAANGAPRGGARRGTGRQQNGRPQRGRQFDRHSGTGIVDNEKKEKQGWGHPESAEAEAAKDTIAPKDPAAADEAVVVEAAEPEEDVKTLDEYLAEKAKQSLKVSLPEARKANEGAEDQFNNAVAFKKEEEPDFFVSKDTKASKKTTEKQRKEKVIVEIEQRFEEPSRGGFQGERRGGAQRRGGRGGRGNNNTGRRGPKSAAPAVNLQDASAFPSLGASA